MTIVVTAATGNTGERVAQRLIEAGQTVTVLVRHPDKLSDVVRHHAAVYQGSVDDATSLVAATKDADALYLVVPYNFGATDWRGWQRQVGKAAATAIQANSIPHVVNLSSNGAHLADGMGPISGLHDVEQILNKAAPNVIHLRPGFFMENYLMQLEAIRTASHIFLPIPGDRRLAMIATQDIAEVAAKLLLNRSWQGQSVLGLHGPADLSFNEAAAILSQMLDRPITHVQTTIDQFRNTLLQMGASETVAAEYGEMWAKLAQLDYAPAEPRTSETTTPTTLAQFVQDALLPLLPPVSTITPA